MTANHKFLSQILFAVRENQAQNKKCLAVFDLDSTLFDVGPRLEQILLDFAADQENQKRFPIATQHMKNIRTQRSDWGFGPAMVRAGLDGHHPELEEAVKAFWHQRFFSNEYLFFDRPYDGAVEFVQEAHRSGAHIAYVTGRDVERMGEGSLAVLQKWNFPVEEERAELILKPHRKMNDAEFKRDWFVSKKLEAFARVWFFENEPVNINLILRDLPQVENVFFESTHSGQESAPENINRITHFFFAEDAVHGQS